MRPPDGSGGPGESSDAATWDGGCTREVDAELEKMKAELGAGSPAGELGAGAPAGAEQQAGPAQGKAS